MAINSYCLYEAITIKDHANRAYCVRLICISVLFEADDLEIDLAQRILWLSFLKGSPYEGTQVKKILYK
jgi:hypothetical protein